MAVFITGICYHTSPHGLYFTPWWQEERKKRAIIRRLCVQGDALWGCIFLSRMLKNRLLRGGGKLRVCSQAVKKNVILISSYFLLLSLSVLNKWRPGHFFPSLQHIASPHYHRVWVRCICYVFSHTTRPWGQAGLYLQRQDWGYRREQMPCLSSHCTSLAEESLAPRPGESQRVTLTPKPSPMTAFCSLHERCYGLPGDETIEVTPS